MSDSGNSSAPRWLPEQWDFIDWGALVGAARRQDYLSYAIVVRDLAGAEVDPQRQAALEVLASVLELRPLHGQEFTNEALGPADRFAALDRDAIAALAKRAKTVDHPAIRARLLDVAWQKNRACSHDETRDGVISYLEAGQARLTETSWPLTVEFYARATSMAASLGKNGPALHDALSKVEEAILEVGEDDPLFLVSGLMGILLRFRAGDPKTLSRLAKDIAKKALKGGPDARTRMPPPDYDRARTYLLKAARWHEVANKTKKARATMVRVARLHEEEAKAYREQGGHSQEVASLEQAIGTLRGMGGQAQRITTLRRKLQRAQRAMAKAARGSFKSTVQSTLDLSDSVAQARDHVRGKVGLDALVSLCSLVPSPDPAKLREQAVENLRESPFYAWVPKVSLSEIGRRVHRTEGVVDGTDAALDGEVHRLLAFQQQLVALGAVVPAAAQVQLELGLRTEDFFALASASSFVPEGREMSFANGLSAGMNGDFETAGQLLLPQVENAVRHLLERGGAITTTLPSSGLQNELDLNALVRLDEFVDLFGDETAFELRGLLTEKAGTNLRNEWAHGLISDGRALPFYVYFWWRVLAFVLLPVVETSAKEST